METTGFHILILYLVNLPHAMIFVAVIFIDCLEFSQHKHSLSKYRSSVPSQLLYLISLTNSSSIMLNSNGYGGQLCIVSYINGNTLSVSP